MVHQFSLLLIFFCLSLLRHYHIVFLFLFLCKHSCEHNWELINKLYFFSPLFFLFISKLISIDFIVILVSRFFFFKCEQIISRIRTLPVQVMRKMKYQISYCRGYEYSYVVERNCQSYISLTFFFFEEIKLDRIFF